MLTQKIDTNSKDSTRSICGQANGASPFFQPKLTVNTPYNQYEREADALGEQVVKMSSMFSFGNGTNKFQTKPDLQLKCAACQDEEEQVQMKSTGGESTASPDLASKLSAKSGSGQPLPSDTQALMGHAIGADFSAVRVHTDSDAIQMNRELSAHAFTHGRDVYFNAGKYEPGTTEGKRLLGHELGHVVQQGGIGQAIQMRSAPYIKKIAVHLAPSQTADLEWQGTPPPEATGSDHFTVSTGKGYGDPGDPPGTCKRMCCDDPDTQCAPPWNRPDKVGACCTYYGDSFWTGTPKVEHNGWAWWTPIQPYYSQRGIALHSHFEVTGQPIGHGCVRMDEPNAKRIFNFSNGRRTNVTIDGRAAPVACEDARKCTPPTGSNGEEQGMLDSNKENQYANLLNQEPEPGMEGILT